jgi:hypothetical protein
VTHDTKQREFRKKNVIIPPKKRTFAFRFGIFKSSNCQIKKIKAMDALSDKYGRGYRLLLKVVDKYVTVQNYPLVSLFE